MNPYLVRRAIKAFIRSHEDELVSGLESGSRPKAIGQITTARGTPALQRIFIAIVDTEGLEVYDDRDTNTVRYSTIVAGTPENTYQIQVHVGDYAQRQTGESTGGDYEAYEKDTEAFETFVSRLQDLFRKYTSIPPESGSWTIEVIGDGKRIRGQDFSQRVTDDAGAIHEALYRILYLQIRTCGEPRPLSRA